VQNISWSNRYEISCCGIAAGKHKIANLTENREVRNSGDSVAYITINWSACP
jgi:hypothetical protein